MYFRPGVFFYASEQLIIIEPMYRTIFNDSFWTILHKKKINLCRENLSINFSYDLHNQKKMFYLTLPLSSILMSPKSMTVKPFSSSLSIRPACHVMIKQVLSDRSMEVWLPHQQADMRVDKEIWFYARLALKLLDKPSDQWFGKLSTL